MDESLFASFSSKKEDSSVSSLWASTSRSALASLPDGALYPGDYTGFRFLTGVRDFRSSERR